MALLQGEENHQLHWGRTSQHTTSHLQAPSGKRTHLTYLNKRAQSEAQHERGTGQDSKQLPKSSCRSEGRKWLL